MLEELRITGLGVIEESVLDLGPGFTVITGETGAGKTMVVTALGLLLGGRSDSGVVRTGADSARVEGWVDLTDCAAEATSGAADVGASVEEGRVLLARQVSARGRSRAYVGGASVPLTSLESLAAPLVAVHGQSDQHRLLRPSAQLRALDRFAGAEVTALHADYTRARGRLREVESSVAEMVSARRERAREADVLRFGLQEISAVDPGPGEDGDLVVEESRLGHADTLRQAAERAHEALSSVDTGHEVPDALGTTAAARALLDGVREHDAYAAGLADRLAEVGYLLADIASDLASYATSVETDPARLAAVSERRAALAGLTRKYGEDAAQVLEWARTATERLQTLEGTEDRVAQLRGEAEDLRTRLATVAGDLSRRRCEAAERLGEVVTGELAQLAMPHARFTVALSQRPDEDGLLVGEQRLRPGPDGVDEVEFLLAAHPGAPARPLARVASGGELSRVMLGVEVALAGTEPVPTFVFDEVDAGVGGKAAVEVGRRLARLAHSAQVLVVTHLPQVAAFADRHVVVHKSEDGSVTTSGLHALDDAGRVRELSRMLAGLEDSETALAHAEELLSAARATR